MTNEAANLLIAFLCLVSLVLAGGFTQAIVPDFQTDEFVIQTGDGWCPEDRIVRGCVPSNLSGDAWQVQLFEPFLEGLVATDEPEEEESSDGSSSSTSTADSASQTEATESAHGPGAGTGDGAGATSSSAGTGPPTPTDGAAGLDLGSRVGWLLWPVLVLTGGIAAIGLALGLRRSSLESPRDLLRVPGYAIDILLSLLVRSATRLAAWAGEQRARIVALVSAIAHPRSPTPGHGFANRLTDGRSLVDGLVSMMGALLKRIPGGTDAEPVGDIRGDSEDPAGGAPERLGGEFDIERAWAWLAGRTTARPSRPRTPEDIARKAVADGYPRTAVNDLLAAFRDVTYGDLPPTGDRLEAARRAYETLQGEGRSPGEGAE